MPILTLLSRSTVCSCLPSYIGSPPNCRPECVSSSECELTKSCVNQRCVPVCPGPCAHNAVCRAVNHGNSSNLVTCILTCIFYWIMIFANVVAICACDRDFIGDPFVGCQQKPPVREHVVTNPCVPSPCGPNAECRNINGVASCSCLPSFLGAPPNCRPECVVNDECPSDRACVQNHCIDPCLGSCGSNAYCRTVSHSRKLNN